MNKARKPDPEKAARHAMPGRRKKLALIGLGAIISAILAMLWLSAE